MRPFEVASLERNRVEDVVASRAQIDFSPAYQRQSDLWSRDKEQLFIDSLLNGFDIPKLYFHRVADAGYLYAVVDGKQRMSAILDFVDDEFALADDFQWFEDESVLCAGMRYSELPPRVQARLDDYRLPIEVVHTQDIEWVEELFSRLNEATALNAPERRNAFGGPLPEVIRRLPGRDFFRDRLPFGNNRYKHLDLATKLLFLEHSGGPAATKKGALDAFVRDFKERGAVNEALDLERRTTAVLTRLEPLFAESDVLLSSLGLVVIYFLLERERFLSGLADCRSALAEFDELRRQVRSLMRRGQPRVELDAELVEFERLSQSPNDVAAMTSRSKLLRRYLSQPNLIRDRLEAMR